MVKPLMRELYAQGELAGPPAELMQSPPAEMLYDTEKDPYEINNLVNSDMPEHKRVLAEMRRALDEWILDTGDLGGHFEPDSLVATFEVEMDEWFGTPEWYESK